MICSVRFFSGSKQQKDDRFKKRQGRHNIFLEVSAVDARFIHVSGTPQRAR